MSTDQVFCGRYKIVKQIGSGSFSKVFLGIDTVIQKEVSIKLEEKNAHYKHLINEVKIIQNLQDQDGFPQLLWFGEEDNYKIMVTNILGPSLEDLFNYCGRKFSIRTVIMLADQIISRIEYLHTKNYIHRDLKPENFLIGLGKQADLLYLIDFGLSKKYSDPRTSLHIPQQEIRDLTGTARYVSINTHLGIEQSRRDDLESIGYMIMYFLRGDLPWQNVTGTTIHNKYVRISEIKSSTPIDVLCKGFPDEFDQYLQYCKNLQFEEKPDYTYIKRIFMDLFYKIDNNWNFIYDWALKSIEDDKNVVLKQQTNIQQQDQKPDHTNDTQQSVEQNVTDNVQVQQQATTSDFEVAVQDVEQQTLQQADSVEQANEQQTQEQVETVEQVNEQQTQEQVETVEQDNEQQTQEQVESVEQVNEQQTQEQVESVEQVNQQQTQDLVESVEQVNDQQTQDQVESVEQVNEQQTQDQVDSVEQINEQQTQEQADEFKADEKVVEVQGEESSNNVNVDESNNNNQEENDQNADDQQVQKEQLQENTNKQDDNQQQQQDEASQQDEQNEKTEN